VRRERMGHIELASPTAHLVPEVAAVAHRLDARHALREIERVLYFEPSWSSIPHDVAERGQLRPTRCISSPSRSTATNSTPHGRRSGA